jgi:Rhodanese-like domain
LTPADYYHAQSLTSSAGHHTGGFNLESGTIKYGAKMKRASISRTCLITASLIILALLGCTPGAPSSAVEPTPATTPDSAPISPSERVPRITDDGLLQKINSHANILIVDSRIDVEKLFDSGHIIGAIPVPLSAITEGQWSPPADLNQEIIFYCT